MENSLYQTAYFYYENGFYTKAEKLFSDLLEQFPWNLNYWHALASAQQADRNYKSALQSWSILSVMDKISPHPHFHAAECLLALAKPKEALVALANAKKRCVQTNLPFGLNSIWE